MNEHTSENELSDTLLAMRVLIEKGWTQGAFSRDAQGGADPKNNEAKVCWCLSGAMRDSLDWGVPNRYSDITYLLNLAVIEHNPSYYHKNYLIFNDAKETTKAKVLEVINTAIELAKEIQMKEYKNTCETPGLYLRVVKGNSYKEARVIKVDQVPFNEAPDVFYKKVTLQ